jgi:tetratricopeptide (TPR) repeat protein
LLIGRGNVYLTKNQPELARRDYIRVLHVDPRRKEALINIAYAFQQQGFYKRAWRMFNQAIAIDESCHEAYEGRAIVHLTMKNLLGALNDMTKAIVRTLFNFLKLILTP